MVEEEAEVDHVFLDLQKRVAGASQALLELVGEHPGREWTVRELVDDLWRRHRCRPAVVSIAMHGLAKRGSLEIMANQHIRTAPKGVAGLAV